GAGGPRTVGSGGFRGDSGLGGIGGNRVGVSMGEGKVPAAGNLALRIRPGRVVVDPAVLGATVRHSAAGAVDSRRRRGAQRLLVEPACSCSRPSAGSDWPSPWSSGGSGWPPRVSPRRRRTEMPRRFEEYRFPK